MRDTGVYDSNDMNDICAMNDTQKNYSGCYPPSLFPETFVAYFFKNIENPLKMERRVFHRIQTIFADRNLYRVLEHSPLSILDKSLSKLRKNILSHTGAYVAYSPWRMRIWAG